MGLLQDWQAVAFNENADRGQLQNFWSRYFAIEKQKEKCGGKKHGKYSY